MEVDDGRVRVKRRRAYDMVITSRRTEAALASCPLFNYIRFLLGNFDRLLKFGYLANGCCEVVIVWGFSFLVSYLADSNEVLHV